MRYLTLIPDYTNSCLQDDFEGYLQLSELKLSHNLLDSLKKWHEEYKKIIPLPIEQRNKIMDQINNLDRDGLKLAKQISKEIPGGAKVKYFSEGQLKYIN